MSRRLYFTLPICMNLFFIYLAHNTITKCNFSFANVILIHEKALLVSSKLILEDFDFVFCLYTTGTFVWNRLVICFAYFIKVCISNQILFCEKKVSMVNTEHMFRKLSTGSGKKKYENTNVLSNSNDVPLLHYKFFF